MEIPKTVGNNTAYIRHFWTKEERGTRLFDGKSENGWLQGVRQIRTYVAGTFLLGRSEATGHRRHRASRLGAHTLQQIPKVMKPRLPS